MNRHSDLVHPSFPSESTHMTRMAGDLIKIPPKAANDNKNLQIPDDPSTMGRIEAEWEEMRKRHNKPDLTVIEGDKDK